MSYQVLARKWRPKGFEEVVGQDHVVRALRNAIDQDRMHHAYMFTGTRGVGKTTIARILAKCLNCDAGVTAQPCEQCEACIAVNEGRFVDLIEVDGASRTKVEDTRELLDNVQYAPVQGRTKIYLIDEVHMLSTHSFNALLKTLEEPPAHVKFLLATTDPQKVPITILSRCLQFTLKQLTPEMIADHLATVLTAEKIVFEPPALLALGKAARGSARDALSLTDQAIAYGGGEITQEQVQTMLGTVHQQALEQVLIALSSQDPVAVLQIVEVLVRDGIDIQQLVQDLLGALHRLSLAKSVPALLNQSDEADQAWLRLVDRFSAEALQVHYQIALLGLRDLSWAPDMRAAVEMLLLRMMLFDLQAPPGEAAAGLPPAPSGASVEPAIPSVGEGGSVASGAVSASAASLETGAELETVSAGAPSLGASAFERVQQTSTAAVETEGPSRYPLEHPSQALQVHSQAMEKRSVVVAENAQQVDGLEQGADAGVQAFQAVDTVYDKSLCEQSATEHPIAPSVQASPQSSPDYTPAVGDLPSWLSWIERAIHSEHALTGPALNLARNCVVTQYVEGVLHLSIAPALKMLLTENAQQRLREALIALSPDQILQVKIQVNDHQACTPAEWIQQQAAQALEQANQALQADPFVQAIQNTFSAVLQPDSVRPLSMSNEDVKPAEAINVLSAVASEIKLADALAQGGAPRQLLDVSSIHA